MKSNLEDDISAITLQQPLGGAHEDPTLAMLAKRKAEGSISRLTGKPVAQSHESQVIQSQFGAASFTFTLSGSARIHPDRAHELARLHLQGFFYLITYNEESRGGKFLPQIGWVFEAGRPDWGNRLMYGFANLVANWSPLIVGTGADGFFQIAVRRDRANGELCSFALEWNKSYRIVGFIGDMVQAQKHVDALPELERFWLDGNRTIRQEISLPTEDDMLFALGPEF